MASVQQNSKNSPSSRSKFQSIYASKRTPSSWKDKYRKRCFENLKRNRTKLVDKFRKLGESKSSVRNIMLEEYRHLQDEVDGLPGLMFMEEDGFEFLDAEPDEMEQMLSAFDDIQQELQIEEQHILEEYERLMEHEENDLCSRIQHLHTEEVICPLCKKHPLMENKAVIFCKCDLRINVEADALTIHHLKANLDEGMILHSAGCVAEPEFSQLSGVAGIDNILMTCQVCDFMHIVI